MYKWKQGCPEVAKIGGSRRFFGNFLKTFIKNFWKILENDRDYPKKFWKWSRLSKKILKMIEIFEKFLETKEILQKTLENYQSFRKFLEKFPKSLSKKTDFSIIGWGSPPPPPPARDTPEWEFFENTMLNFEWCQRSNNL